MPDTQNPAEARTLVDLQIAARAEITAPATAAIELAASEERALTAEETELVTRAAAESAEIDAAIQSTVQIVRGNHISTEGLVPRSVGGAIVRSEPTTYGSTRQAAERNPHSYIRDHTAVALGLAGSRSAAERLERHANEMAVEARAGDTGDTAGGTFVPPLWVLSEFVGTKRPGRVTADLARQMSLPGGTDSINIPTITTGNVVDVQATENSAATTRDLVTSSTTADVTTVAGTYDFSLQLLEQSALAGGWDSLVYGELLDDYSRRLDTLVLDGTAANNQPPGIYKVAGTTVYASSTSSTTAQTQIFQGVADAISRISTTRYATPEVIVMHPRRWFWLCSRVDVNGRPMVTPDAAGGQNLLAAMGITAYQGIVGTMLGLPVAIDANVSTAAGTSEDRIAVWKASDAILWEGTPRFEVFRSVLGATTDTLTARARFYNYAAFNSRFTTATAVVGGTALSSPTF
jgi:HK97 family phage major capsid protein